jgi:hypothetical protein
MNNGSERIPEHSDAATRRQGKTATQEETVAALKEKLNNDFIYFVARVNQQSKMVCTCGEFEEYAENSASGENHLAKTALRHCRKTGHALNPRGT